MWNQVETLFGKDGKATAVLHAFRAGVADVAAGVGQLARRVEQVGEQRGGGGLAVGAAARH